MKNIYVSAAWNDAMIIRDIYKKLRENGWNITRPWAEIVSDIDMDADLKTESVLVAKAVADADVILVYVDNKDYPYRGLTYEIGIAIGLNKQIIMINNLPDTCYTMENMALYHPNIQRYRTTDIALIRLGCA